MDRRCIGCGVSIVPGRRERNPRKWCSESCRQRTYREENPEYRERCARLAADRHRRTYVPVVHEKKCTVCSSPFTAGRTDCKYCSDRCRYRQHYLGRRGRKRGAEQEPYTIAEIGDRDGWVCGICGGNLDRSLSYPDLMAPSIDHIVPLARGGSDLKENVQVSHLHCNRQKGARLAVVDGSPARGRVISPDTGGRDGWTWASAETAGAARG